MQTHGPIDLEDAKEEDLQAASTLQYFTQHSHITRENRNVHILWMSQLIAPLPP